MITIATYDNQVEAHIAVGRLNAEGIDAELADAHLVQTDWLYGAALGGIKVQVPEGQAAWARDVLAEDHSAGLAEAAMEAEPEEAPAEETMPEPASPANVDRWAPMVHFAAFAGAIVPFGHLAGPLLVWLWRRRLSPQVDAQGKAAVNFQISITLYALAVTVIVQGEAATALLIALFGLDMVAILVAVARVRRGQAFRYPLSLRILL
ncbi:MAG TPA: DUF4870 domain-containing protein [Gammaproteobacteria bacterium]|nr:DUF4870 domain-containing protein [Gammaproteobacteria bacterium]